jgi:hypothetical protein
MTRIGQWRGGVREQAFGGKDGYAVGTELLTRRPEVVLPDSVLLDNVPPNRMGPWREGVRE